MLPFRSALAALTDTFVTSKRTSEQTCSPEASSKFCDLLLTSKEELKLSQLSTSQLRQLCKHDGVIEASGDRSALLASIRTDSTKYHWNVQNSQVGFQRQLHQQRLFSPPPLTGCAYAGLCPSRLSYMPLETMSRWHSLHLFKYSKC